MRFKMITLMAGIMILILASVVFGGSVQWEIVGTVYGPPGREFMDPTGISFDGAHIIGDRAACACCRDATVSHQSGYHGLLGAYVCCLKNND